MEVNTLLNGPSQTFHSKLRYIAFWIVNFIIIVFVIFKTNKVSQFKNGFSSESKLQKHFEEIDKTHLRDLQDENIFDIIQRGMNGNLIFDEIINKIHNVLNVKPKQLNLDSIIRIKQKESILANLISKKYSGKWNSFIIGNNSKIKPFKLGEATNGEVKFGFKLGYNKDSTNEIINLEVISNENEYIDNWMITMNTINLNEVTLETDEENKRLSLIGKYNTVIQNGQIFELLDDDELKKCHSIINTTFPIQYLGLLYNYFGKTKLLAKIPTINPVNASLSINSDCGFNMLINSDIYNTTKKMDDLQQKVNSFVYISIIITILSMTSQYFLICQMRNNESLILNIGLFSLGQNCIWHLYASMSFGNLIVHYNFLFNSYGLIALINGINFCTCDLIFLYYYWKLETYSLDDFQYSKQKIIFYSVFYVSLFLSFFYLNKVFYNYYCIVALGFFLWTPQIIYNTYFNNKVGLPIFYMIATSLDRLIYSIYFRGYSNNSLNLKTDLNFIIMIMIYVFFCIIFISLQTIHGPRFMLNEKFSQNKFDFYKDKDELLSINQNISNEECVICLNSIFSAEKVEPLEMVDLSERETLHNSSIDSENGAEKLDNENNRLKGNNIESLSLDIKPISKLNINEQNNKKTNKTFIKDILKKLKILFSKNFFWFYKPSLNISEKLYMLTPCKHIFHSECLEKWLETKKECPNCRNPLGKYF